MQVLFESQGRPPQDKKKAVDLEDMKFHQCVRLTRFESDRTISFIPPDGAFDLMSAPPPAHPTLLAPCRVAMGVARDAPCLDIFSYTAAGLIAVHGLCPGSLRLWGHPTGWSAGLCAAAHMLHMGCQLLQITPCEHSLVRATNNHVSAIPACNLSGSVGSPCQGFLGLWSPDACCGKGRTYRLSHNVKPLIWVECLVEKHSRSRTDYLVKARSQFKERSTATQVEILLPLPPDAIAPTPRTSQAGPAHLSTLPCGLRADHAL